MAERRLLLVDGVGGALAAIGAGVARWRGHVDAGAAPTTAPAALPDEVAAALSEIGIAVPEVVAFSGASGDASVITLGRTAPRIEGATAWAELSLYVPPAVAHAGIVPGDDSVERMSAARIVRDRLERLLEAERAPSSRPAEQRARRMP